MYTCTLNMFRFQPNHYEHFDVLLINEAYDNTTITIIFVNLFQFKGIYRDLFLTEITESALRNCFD